MKKALTIIYIIYILSVIGLIIYITISFTSYIWTYKKQLGDVPYALRNSFNKEKIYDIILYALILFSITGLLIRRILGWGLTIHIIYFYLVLFIVKANDFNLELIGLLIILCLLPIFLMNTKLILSFYKFKKYDRLTMNMVVIVISMIITLLASRLYIN